MGRPVRALDALINAIGHANVNYPTDFRGKQREQRVMDYEEAVHLANAVLFGLRDAGFKIVRIEEAEDASRT